MWTAFVNAAGNGRLTLIGKPGQGQGKDFEIFRCATDANGNPEKFSCQTRVQGRLNSALSVPEGKYLIVYSKMVKPGLVDVRSGSSIEIKLSTLNVREKEKLTKKYDVRADLGDPQEQIALSEYLFFSAKGAEYQDKFCASALVSDHTICKNLKNAKTPEDLKKTIEFGKNATFRFKGQGSLGWGYHAASPITQAKELAVFGRTFSATVYESQGLEQGSRIVPGLRASDEGSARNLDPEASIKSPGVN